MPPSNDPQSLQHHPAALTVDVEDYFHPELVRRHAPPEWREARVEASTLPILDLLERYQVHATFFIVGEVIRSAPRLVKRIAGDGHEIGCHTHTHRPLWELTPDSFRDELRNFRAALRDVVGDIPVHGFRAPTFSLDRRTDWCYRVLEEEGFSYDSSIVPARGPLYGCPDAPREIYRPAREDFLKRDPSGPIVEFPAPVVDLVGGRLPVGGGLYLRALPFWIYWRFVKRVLRERPFFLYVHPWETDPEIPKCRLPGFSRWATYWGIGGMLKKLERLLQRIRFTTMRSTLEASGFGV